MIGQRKHAIYLVSIEVWLSWLGRFDGIDLEGSTVRYTGGFDGDVESAHRQTFLLPASWGTTDSGRIV